MQIDANDIKRHKGASRALVVVRFVAVTVVSLVVGLAAAWILAVAWIAARANVTAPGPAAADELLALAAASLAVAIAAWLVLGTALEVLAHVPGRVGRVAQVWADRLTPALARRIAAFVLGVGVGVAGGPTQAVASPRGAVTASSVTGSSLTASSVPDPGFAPAHSAPDLPELDPGFGPATSGPDFSPAPIAPATAGFTAAAPNPGFASEPAAPGFTPAAPRVRPQADPGLLGGRVNPTPDREIVVHRGDTLWSIAARHLGAQASDAEIAQAWPRWFDLNRGLIGDDPDHILPGQILRIPGADQTASVNR
ncbi:LysM peptidoglycan-binding domain-containing protein [Knoellia sp. S7-12]|uniref:LysM peptidoglycan-binding domain-containing protein n=1 Tax=Knoellia sp. S7-12 TaxID=3126698 RepID=UPI003365F63B